MISQDHTKLDADMIEQYTESMIQADVSIKVKVVIVEI